MEGTPGQAVAAVPGGSGRYVVNAVASALVIFAKVVEDGSTSLEGAAEAAQVSRSTAYRLVTTLTELGLLERIPGRGYIPGAEAFRWATRLHDQFDLSKAASPVLLQLRDTFGETANLAVIQGSTLIYAEVLESPGILRTVESVGSRVPLHAAAIGKVVAAFLDEPLLQRMLGEEPYQRFAEATLTTWGELEQDLAAIRERGYALDMESVEPGVMCIAAPIFRSGRVAGGISLSGPRTRLTEARLEDLSTVISEAAAEVSRLVSPLTPLHLRGRQA